MASSVTTMNATNAIKRPLIYAASGDRTLRTQLTHWSDCEMSDEKDKALALHIAEAFFSDRLPSIGGKPFASVHSNPTLNLADKIEAALTTVRQETPTCDFEHSHERQAMLVRQDGMMCEAHPGQEFGHDSNCAGPGMPWLLEGKNTIERFRWEVEREVWAKAIQIAKEEAFERRVAHTVYERLLEAASKGD
jgi:hypothetical protein